MKEYENDIDLFYIRNSLVRTQTTEVVKWCVSACMVAHENKIEIDIRKHFPHYVFYSIIHREIVYHGFDYPLANKVKTYWHTTLLRRNVSYASKHKKRNNIS